MSLSLRNDGNRTAPEISTPRPVEIAFLVVILVVAGVLRLGWPGLTEFKADEARLTTLALDMAEGKAFPIRGISSSVGLANFPMSVWLYTLPLIVWQHVYAATLFTGLLNTLAVLGCWYFVRRYWGAEAALAAALMFAVSPWAIHHSRKIWAQNLLPFFVMGWTISGALAFIEQRPKFIVWHILCLAIAIEAHLAAAALLPATLTLLVIFRRRLDWRFILLGGGLVLLTALPFVYYLVTTGERISAALSTTAGSSWRLSTIPFRYAWLLSTGQEIHALVGATALDEYLASVPNIAPVQWLWGALIVSGLVWLSWRVWQRGYGHYQEPVINAELLVFIWLLAPLFFFTLSRLPVALHYLLPIYPAPYIAVGILFSRLGQRWRGLGWIALLVSAVSQVWLWAGLLSFMSSHATPGGFGQPLARQLQAATIATRLLAEENAAEVLIAGAGESPEQEEFPAVYATLLRAVPHRFVDIRRSAVFPATPAIVLLASEVGQAGALYEAAAIRREHVPLREGEGAISLLALPAAAAPAPQITLESPQILTNWAAFLGYDLPLLREDATALWQIYWYTGEPALIDYHIFNHLLNAGGARISQADAAAFPARQWRQGDVVISRFTLPWPRDAARPLTMRTGMYTYPQSEAVLLFDVAGNPYTDALEITLP